MKYGQNSNLVEEVIKFVETGKFFSEPYHGALENVVLEKDLELAKECAWSQEDANSPLTWSDLREQEMAEVMGQRYSLSDFDEADEELGGLIDEFGSVLQERLSGEFLELIDDIVGDLYNVAYCRSVNGVTNGLLEKIYQAYLNGGWPCGWRGNFPKGELIVYSAG
jgi:hypothetical protein